VIVASFTVVRHRARATSQRKAFRMKSRRGAHRASAWQGHRWVKKWLILGGVAAVALVIALIVLVTGSGTPPTYQQGYSYATKYMAAPGAGSLAVPVSFLPHVCGSSSGINNGNPYGVPGAPGANPGAAWIRGCIAGIEASPNFKP
jgi:hypothetical protein